MSNFGLLDVFLIYVLNMHLGISEFWARILCNNVYPAITSGIPNVTVLLVSFTNQ
jgi:hypothetical protein